MASKIMQTEFVETGYGKNYVKLLQVKHEGRVHHIKEMEVSTELTLNNVKDYLDGDNSDIIATDSQKNTVYILARQYGIKSIEEFALSLCKHFLRKYHHVVNTRVYIQEAPWKRIDTTGRQHVHAFISCPEVIRFCEVTRSRGGNAIVSAGLKDMKILKTTQSAFKGFVSDEYRTLPDADDRVFCTVVQSKWWYNMATGFNFDKVWEGVKTIILETFAGPADTGIYSPSVQNTLYLSERNILAQIPQIEKIEMCLPNVHNFGVDFSRFPRIDFSNSKQEIFMPVDKPSGIIRASIQRGKSSKL